MILFKEENDKYNFIDDKDHFVGYSAYPQCCESFGWYLSSQPNILDNDRYSFSDRPPALPNTLLQEYHFDVSIPVINEGDEASFTLRKDDNSDDVIYLVLYNHHNGYYGHGWDTNWGCEGYL